MIERFEGGSGVVWSRCLEGSRVEEGRKNTNDANDTFAAMIDDGFTTYNMHSHGVFHFFFFRSKELINRWVGIGWVVWEARVE